MKGMLFLIIINTLPVIDIAIKFKTFFRNYCRNYLCISFQCGQVLGDTLLNLSRAWELADTSTSHSLASKLPGLEEYLTDNAKSGKIICKTNA